MHDINDQLHDAMPIKGCLFGLLFAAPLWILAGLFAWWIFTS